MSYVCGNYMCTRYGCQGHCQNGFPPSYNYSIPSVALPRGCVCPPTSERTCQADYCPRKPAFPRDTDGSPKGPDPQGLDGEAATAGAAGSGIAQNPKPIRGANP